MLLRLVASTSLLLAAHAEGAAGDPHESRRLRIVNGCHSNPLWIAHAAGGGQGPDRQDVKIDPLAYFDFSTADGLAAARYWPKMACDEAGGSCAIGDSGGPSESCVIRHPWGDDYSHCAPPVDTKFEASFGINGEPCNPMAPGGTQMRGCDYVDMSLVDGFTLPVKLQIYGDCTDSRHGETVQTIDCSELSLQQCPTDEVLTAAGMTVNLQAVNPKTKQVAGCYSPCMRLVDDKWTAEHSAPTDPRAQWYCCPTPPISPAQCRTGPVASTQYVNLIKSKCPGAYSYSYDDGSGLLRCSASTMYVLTFLCPSVPLVREPHTRGEAPRKDNRTEQFFFP